MSLPNIIQQINSKFPITGGVLTGKCEIRTSGNDESFLLKNLNDDSTVIPTTRQARAFRIYDKNGKILGDIRFGHETTGEINTAILARYTNAEGTASNATLQLSPNSGGTAGSMYLKFNGQHVITASNPYTITHKTTVLAKRDVDTSYLEMFSGTTYKNGAFLRLDSKGGANAGQFRLQTGDGTTNKVLNGKPDGTLTWDGSNVITQSNLNLCLPNYSAGILVGTCSSAQVITYTAPKDGIISIDLLIHNGASYLKINGINIISNTVPNTSYINNNTCFYPVTKGDNIQVYTKYTSTSYCSQKIYFYPFKGAK